MHLIFKQSELGLAGWITGYKKLSHRIETSHKPYSGDQHIVHKVLSIFQCPDQEQTVLSVTQIPQALHTAMKCFIPEQERGKQEATFLE